jgi:hypothetical protein
MMKTISEAWKDTKEVLKHKEGESSKLLYNFLMDLELGLNVPKGSTGARSPTTLLRLSRCLTTIFNLIDWKVLEINQREIHELFKKMKDGEIKKTNGDNYKDVSEFIKNAQSDPRFGIIIKAVGYVNIYYTFYAKDNSELKEITAKVEKLLGKSVINTYKIEVEEMIN